MVYVIYMIMKRFPIYILLVFVGLLSTTTSCIEDDFTTNSNDVLAFSTDTIAFDTIFTELPTPVRTFRVFNHSKKMIKISQIKVKGESTAKFNLNVDGIKGESFNDVEIRGNDSISIMVQAVIDPTNKNNPLEYKDVLQFVTNGVTQEIVLTAWGQDVIRLKSPQITENTTFTADKPYVIFDTLQVAENATLTLMPGTTLYFHDKGAMIINGKLIAIGDKDHMINLRGDRTDNVVGSIDFDIMSGQWGGVNFTKSSYDNEMQYVYMRGSSTGVTLDSCDQSKKKLHLFNSVLHNSSSNVLNSKYSWIEAEGTEFSDAKFSVVSFTGGKVRMINCTFANYYLFSAITGSIVNLDYLLPDHFEKSPLMDANFDNCIIYGNASDINIGNLTGSNVYFYNTLFKSIGTNDDNFINCKWGGDPKFFTVREDYIFDYRLKNKSDAIGNGDRDLCPDKARYDRYGNDRFASNALDMGAYVWIEQQEDKK